LRVIKENQRFEQGTDSLNNDNELRALIESVQQNPTNATTIKQLAEKYIERKDQTASIDQLRNLSSLESDTLVKKDISGIIELIMKEKFSKSLKKLKSLPVN